MREFKFIVAPWADDPPPDKQRIKICTTPSGEVMVVHPDRKPLVLRGGEFVEVDFGIKKIT